MKNTNNDEMILQLYQAVLSLQTVEECSDFFNDLCTTNELASLSQRFEVGRMLLDEKTYVEIMKKTGASTATISRVNRMISSGCRGFTLADSRLSEDNEEK